MKKRTVKTVNLYAYIRVSTPSQKDNQSRVQQLKQVSNWIDRRNAENENIQFVLKDSISVVERATELDTQVEFEKLLLKASQDYEGALFIAAPDRLTRRYETTVRAYSKVNIYASGKNDSWTIAQLMEEMEYAEREPDRIIKRASELSARSWLDPNKHLYQRGKYRDIIDANGNTIKVKKITQEMIDASAYNRKQKTIGDTTTGRQNRRTYNKVMELRNEGKSYLEIAMYLNEHIVDYPYTAQFFNTKQFRERNDLEYSKKELFEMQQNGEIFGGEVAAYLKKVKRCKELDRAKGWISICMRKDSKGNYKQIKTGNKVISLIDRFEGRKKSDISSTISLEIKNGILYFGTNRDLNKEINKLINSSAKGTKVAARFNELGIKYKQISAIDKHYISRWRKRIKEQKSVLQTQQSYI